jgi:formylglycine-generating enzyme
MPVVDWPAPPTFAAVVLVVCTACTPSAPSQRGYAHVEAGANPTDSSTRASIDAAEDRATGATATAQSIPASSPDGAAESWIESLGLTVTTVHREPRFAWRQVEQMHWQAVADGQAPLPEPQAMDSKGCPAGMVLIEGGYLLDTRGRDDTDEVLFMQNHACTHWLTEDRSTNALCDRFDRNMWKSLSARLARKPMRLCIDRYEFPNAYGEFPLVVATFSESEKLCAKVAKRLCTENEWTFACEGEEGVPFPNGYERDAVACNIGVLAPAPDGDTFKPRFLERTARGIDLAWRGRRSGESPRCRSPFGVEDMTGNVDEWTRSSRAYGYKMILKGGHWGPGRQRCRPQTRGHGPFYIRYDQGFRCCQDPQKRL